MFKKEGSCSHSQKKKAKDVPLRKSDRRKLRDAFVSHCTHLASLENHTDHEKTLIEGLIDDIFLNGDLRSRKVKLGSADGSPVAVVTAYLRSSGAAAVPPSTSSSNEAAAVWPYTTSTQTILLEMEHPYLEPPTVVYLPSLAMLSVLPSDLLRTPIITVAGVVSRYLCRGADLMRSGMHSLPPRCLQDQPVTAVLIRVQGNPQPFAVGFLTPQTNPQTIGAGTKGVGVKIVTCYGDDFWLQQFQECQKYDHKKDGYDAGNYGNVGFVGGTIVRALPTTGQADNHDFHEENARADENSNLGDDSDGDTIRTPKGVTDCFELSGGRDDVDILKTPQQEEVDIDTDSGTDGACTKGEDGDSHNESDETIVDDALAADKILLQAFRASLLQIPKDCLPMPVSTFYSKYLLPAISTSLSSTHRTDDETPGTSFNMKSTSYKKIGSFLLEQARVCDSGGNGKAVITVGATADGRDKVAFLTGIDRSHIDLRDARRARQSYEQSGAAPPVPSGKTKLAVVNLFVLPPYIGNLLHLNDDAVKAMHATSETRRGTGFLTAPECRNILEEYVRADKLVDEHDSELVLVDGPLCDALYRPTKQQQIAAKTAGGTVYYPTTVTRKELHTKWLEKMDEAYALVEIPGNRIINMKRGAPPKVVIEVKARQNRNKFITMVRGVEEYGIDAVTFANDVAKRFACASVVDENPERRAALKKGRVELMFQGHLVDELKALLTGNDKLSSHGGAKDGEYCLPKGVIEAVTLGKNVPIKRRG